MTDQNGSRGTSGAAGVGSPGSRGSLGTSGFGVSGTGVTGGEGSRGGGDAGDGGTGGAGGGDAVLFAKLSYRPTLTHDDVLVAWSPPPSRGMDETPDGAAPRRGVRPLGARRRLC